MGGYADTTADVQSSIQSCGIKPFHAATVSNQLHPAYQLLLDA
jgi:hypothetical protein